jgi:predicted dinucleotide-binding enzyme
VSKRRTLIESYLEALAKRDAQEQVLRDHFEKFYREKATALAVAAGAKEADVKLVAIPWTDVADV